VVTALLADVSTFHEDRAIDVVIMSGDLAFSGQPGEFRTAELRLLDPLQEALKLTRDRIILVPGNHDVDRALVDQDLEAGLRVRLDGREAANELLSNPERLANAAKRLSAWNDFHSTFYGESLPPVIPPLGRLHTFEVSDGTLGIAALNTAWRSSSDDDRAHLVLGDQQVRAAMDSLDSADVRVVVFHHPFEWLTQWDADEVRRLVAKVPTLVLTGHDHVADPPLETTVRGTTLHSRGACLYESFEYRNGNSVIDVDVQQRSTRVSLRSWQRERREFDEAVELTAGGILEVNWPTASTEIALRPDVPFSSVMSNLAEIVQQRSIIADYLSERGGELDIDDVLVAPRLWPLPYREALVAATVRDAPKPDRLDNRKLLADVPTHVVNG